MPRNLWTITISGVGENRNKAAGDVDAILVEAVARLKEAGHESLSHRVTYDQREEGPPVLKLAPAPGTATQVLAAGGTLRTVDGLTTAVPAGSTVAPVAAQADGTVLVSVMAPDGAHLGTGTVTHADDTPLKMTMAPLLHAPAETGAPSPFVVAGGGTLLTREGVSVAVPPGSIATATLQQPDGTVVVSVVNPAGTPLGTGTVTQADGTPVRLAMPHP